MEKKVLTEIPSSKRAYAFADLPKETREKLLKMQKTDGDFLRTGGRTVAKKIVWLFLLAPPLIIFIAYFNSSADLENRFVYLVGSIILLLWAVYFILTLLITLKAPIKNHTYLTPTQLVETENGMVRYRQLTDVSEIKINSFRAENQRYYELHLLFADGDFYEYYCFVRGSSKQQATVNKWQETAATWKNEATGALQRGDAAYFNSHDIFQKSAMANVPVRKGKSRQPLITALWIITFALPVASYLVYLSIE